jgi:transcriptional regulator with PAS, ATPase and Fis domain
MDRISSRSATTVDIDAELPGMVVASPVMTELIQLADRAGDSGAKVLITGESGVGKDLVARRIHDRSPRRSAVFVAVNCAGLTDTLLESELFGHVKGSFTGAYRDKAGMLQLAHRGTLFLDEVGEMSLRMQALLLRFLENGEIQAVGSERTHTKVDVRVIAATNRNLSEMVAAGTFREDLLYRLRVIHLHVPPLRERLEDIRPLVQRFVSRNGRQVTFTEDAYRALERHRWPGNVRELLNVVEQTLWLASTRTVDAAQLPAAIRATEERIVASEGRRRQVADDLYHAVVKGGYSFWEHIYPLFLNRDITRHDMRELVRHGLSVTHGNYRSLLKLFGMPPQDYKRFLNFLGTHDCRVDFREFRGAGPEHVPSTPFVLFPSVSEDRELRIA